MTVLSIFSILTVSLIKFIQFIVEHITYSNSDEFVVTSTFLKHPFSSSRKNLIPNISSLLI